VETRCDKQRYFSDIQEEYDTNSWADTILIDGVYGLDCGVYTAIKVEDLNVYRATCFSPYNKNGVGIVNDEIRNTRFRMLCPVTDKKRQKRMEKHCQTLVSSRPLQERIKRFG
jgi:hypothetical protein